MPHDRDMTLTQISGLFESQALTVLSTQEDGQPYASLVAFAASDDLKFIYFLTPDTTRKYQNLVANPKVAVLVNNSRNRAEDITSAISVTGTGIARKLDTPKSRDALALFLNKQPHLDAFSKAPATALICITIDRYYMVSQFQDVVAISV